MRGLKCLNYNESLFAHLLIRSVLMVDKKSFGAGIVISPECISCDNMKNTILYALYAKLLKAASFACFMGNVGFLFVLEVSSVSSNVNTALYQDKQYGFLLIYSDANGDLDEANERSLWKVVSFCSSSVGVPHPSAYG